MMLRCDQPDCEGGEPVRLNLLLSSGDWDRDTVAEQLPRLLEPMGIRALRVTTGREAADLIRRESVHIAVVDMSMPLERPGDTAGGARTLLLLRRLEQPPPTVVVRPPQPQARESARGLAEALRQGAFAVLDRPLRLESMLEVMRRILRRHYSGQWPGECSPFTN